MTLRYLLENMVDPECSIDLYINGRFEMFYKAGMLLKNMRKSALANTVTKIAPDKDLKNILEIHIETKGINRNKNIPGNA